MDIETLKRQAAQAAAAVVPDGAVVGLGSGSTAAHAIRHLGERSIDIRGIPTSFQAREIALEAGIPIVELDQVERIDLAIDGADQIGPTALIKGGGGAHTREKIIDTAAEQLLIVADERKHTEQLAHPVPIEVLPAARTMVADQVRTLGGAPVLRRATEKSGPVVTDNGNLLLDCAFETIDAPSELAEQLASIPGVIEHGLFVGQADRVYLGRDTGVETIDRKA